MDPSPRGAVALVHAHAKVCTDVAWPRLDLAIAIDEHHADAQSDDDGEDDLVASLAP